MLRKVGRLFTIKTRWEAWLVIYAIALGAVERGRLYLETYPGFQGWLLASACLELRVQLLARRRGFVTVAGGPVTETGGFGGLGFGFGSGGAGLGLGLGSDRLTLLHARVLLAGFVANAVGLG